MTVERALAALAVASVAGLGLFVLAGLRLTGTADALDPLILTSLRAWLGETGPVIALARGITALGNDLTLWAVSLLAAGYLLAALRRGDALHLLGTAALGGLLTATIKGLVARPRPTLVAHLVDVSSLSFPSGHAANASFVYGTVALIAARHAAVPAARRYVAGALLLLVLLIGLSRVILGVHWPTDVLVGWAEGAGWALLADRIARAIRHRAAPRPGE